MRFLLLAAVLVSASPALAAPVTYNLSGKNGSKQIRFESKAPVEYIEGEADEVTGLINADFSKPGLGLRASVSVPVASMRTGMDQRDQHMRSQEWLNADRFPSIRFELDPVDGKKLKARGKDTWAGTVAGAFSLKGVTKRISVPVTIKAEGESIVVEGRFPVRLADHNIRGPVAMRMIGMKVSETVQVSFRLVGVKDKGWGNVKSRKRRSW